MKFNAFFDVGICGPTASAAMNFIAGSRALIVNLRDNGGAHPVAGYRIDEHFMIGVPLARAINPITRTNWEGTGVAPDVPVPAADALTTARKLVREGVRQ